MKKPYFSILAIVLLAFGLAGNAHALNANTNYTVSSGKVNGDGTLTTIETVPATTDASGKLSFSLSSLPSNADANFIVFTIKDANGAVARQGIAPAPPAGDTNQIGINDLATTQATTFLRAATLSGTDDPILASYLLVILRSPNISDSDVTTLASLGKAAITGNGGFEGYMLANVSQASLSALKRCLIYNPDPTKKTLRDFTKGYFTAVESSDAATEDSETQKAGGLMADIFMDAAACAGIELGHITNAHEAAGDAADASGLMASISPNLLSSIDQSMNAFHNKIGMVKMVTEYTNALDVLKATGAQVDQFIAAATAMNLASQAVDTQYGDYFKDPAAYLNAHPGTDANSVQTAINNLYQNAWSTFQTAIAASDADIAALKASVVAAFPGMVLPPDFGKNYNETGIQQNWPVPQVVMVNWLVNLIKGGGSISYTRDTTPIPAMMQQWMGVCTNTQYWDQQNCQSNGGTWTVQRQTFNTPSPAFNAYLGIQQDVQIADMTRNSIWSNPDGSPRQPSKNERMQAETDFITLLGAIENKITALKGNGTSATSAEKDAIIKLMLQPNDN